jgi:glycosyltransferase involved in cell wall biosynthesis
MAYPMAYPKYSFLMTVYSGANVDETKFAIDSMIAQTIQPDEIVIGIDGKIPDALDSLLREYKAQYDDLFSIHYFDVNEGAGQTSAKTLPLCRNEYIARMDADDYSVPDRIQKQFDVMLNNSDIDVVACNVNEFISDIGNVVAKVVLPEKHEDIRKFSKRRCPVRHPALLFKKEDVLRAGNYSNLRIGEDWDIAVKLMMTGLRLYNIQETLVFMRVSPNFYARRGGMSYLKSLHIFKKKFLKMGWFSFKDYYISYYGHVVVALIPNNMREAIYNKFLRG